MSLPAGDSYIVIVRCVNLINAAAATPWACVFSVSVSLQRISPVPSLPDPTSISGSTSTTSNLFVSMLWTQGTYQRSSAAECVQNPLCAGTWMYMQQNNISAGGLLFCSDGSCFQAPSLVGQFVLGGDTSNLRIWNPPQNMSAVICTGTMAIDLAGATLALTCVGTTICNFYFVQSAVYPPLPAPSTYPPLIAGDIRGWICPLPLLQITWSSCCPNAAEQAQVARWCASLATRALAPISAVLVQSPIATSSSFSMLVAFVTVTSQPSAAALQLFRDTLATQPASVQLTYDSLCFILKCKLLQGGSWEPSGLRLPFQ
jgi:hypothetical protein